MGFAVVVCLAVVKAEADADAYYAGYAAAPYAYAAPYAAGYGVTNAANTVGIAGVAHVAKRSADAEPEADADAYYLGGYGLGYGYGGFAYGAYPYAYGAYYGKRSADAEP